VCELNEIPNETHSAFAYLKRIYFYLFYLSTISVALQKVSFYCPDFNFPFSRLTLRERYTGVSRWLIVTFNPKNKLAPVRSDALLELGHIYASLLLPLFIGMREYF
jgi:hypothetical protein